MEALLGAVYLDGGYNAAKQVVKNLMDLAEKKNMPVHTDYRKILYDVLKEEAQTPNYYIEKTVNHHRNGEVTWNAKVFANKKLLGQETGRSMREAAQSAALSALNRADIVDTAAYEKAQAPKIFKNGSSDHFPGFRKMSALSFAEYKFYYDRLSFLGNMAFRLFVTDTFLKALHSPGFVSENRERIKKSIHLSQLPKTQQQQIIKTLDRAPLKSRNMSSAFDFVLGGLYLNNGHEKTRTVVADLALESIETQPKNYKHLLENILRNAGQSRPNYKIKAQKDQYRHLVIVSVLVEGGVLGTAIASKKKQAIQMAARQALQQLGITHAFSETKEW